MLRLEALEIIQRFRKPGGDDFTLFCNKIIRASCWAAGVPQSQLWTCSRTDSKDGGVDTRLGVEISNNGSGYFDTPTIWQFKAAEESGISPADMAKEVNKPRAKNWIEELHAYRLCVCDYLTPDKKQNLLDALTSAVRAINANAPAPDILSIDDIVELANSFPALVLEHRPNADGIFLLFERWKQMATGITRTFVPSDKFEGTKAAVLAHIDFGNDVRSPALILYGAPGAGKTRLTFECLKEVPVADSLVLYTTSEDDVLDLAKRLVNDQTARAIIVADECSIETRESLSRTLMSFRDRIRCLCIDNSSLRVSSASPEFIVPKLSSIELEKVLEANFEQIPQDRRRAYAQYCDGSVRLAADMCAHFDAEIAHSRDLGPIRTKMDEYYRLRLKDDGQREAIEAIALLKRVRHKGDAPTELDLIADLTKIPRDKLEHALSQIKDAPGWVEKGALYYRVTPDLIAWTALECAWSRWAKGNEGDFLKRIPSAIQESFLHRVSENGSAEVRQTVQIFFRKFADDFTPKDLTDTRLVSRFASLVETDPPHYLPALRRVIEAATREDLTRAPTRSRDSWGPRRQLVWAAERFAQFEEYFADCEAILFVLARSECEPTIGNNATKTWQQLFRFVLSGTPVPFTSRLDLIQVRLQEITEGDSELISGLFRELFDLMAVRFLGPAIVGGKVPPPDWRPKDWNETRDSIRAGLRLLDAARRHHIKAIAEGATRALLGDLESLARSGWIDELRPFVRDSDLDESNKAALVSRLKNFLTWGKHSDGLGIKPEFETRLRDWISELEPKSYHARLVEAVGSKSMDYYGREKEWETILDRLGIELLADQNLFEAEIDWLTSPEANSGFEFGSRLGGLDKSGQLLDPLFDKSMHRELGLVRGYIAGLPRGAAPIIDKINLRLNELEEQDPTASFHIALAGGAAVAVFDRATRMITEGKLKATHLRNFTFWVGNERTTCGQAIEALRILTPLASTDSLACDALVDFLGARLHAGEFDTLIQLQADVLWNAITVASEHPGRQAFWLARALSAAAATDLPRAIQLACKGLIGDNFDFSREAAGLLSGWALNFPEEVMTQVGALMLDEKVGWRFFSSKFTIFRAIPEHVVIEWLELVGVVGAQRIARHLPQPYVSDSVPIVPKLTEFVLSRFEEDERTFREFCAGTHSFQLYMGDMASQKEAEAASAQLFFNHPIRRIREWAHYEHDSGLNMAKWNRELEDESGI
jgi:hypothetical protein